MRKIDNKEFIERAREVHGDRYDYSQSEYKGSMIKVKIICPSHGMFSQTPNDHVNNKAQCPLCGKEKSKRKQSLTLQVFIERAREVHGDKYDYSKVEYINNRTKICIICKEHGEFWQTPSNHLQGQGCPKCKVDKQIIRQTKKLNDFIEQVNITHKGKYDYSQVVYKSNKEKIHIICPQHGSFYQKPLDHLQGQGCPLCGKENKSKKNSLSTEEFIERAIEVHGNKYDYSKVEYKNSITKVCIICKEHGEFWQSPSNHLKNHGCPKCANKQISLLKRDTIQSFVEKAKQVHGDKYDYSKVEYNNNTTKVCIICKEHGEFWQRPSDHLQGQGCPLCSQPHMEEEIYKLLNENNIKFISQKRFEWLGQQSLDFYLPDYNIAIECQGEQHFIAKPFFGGKNGLTLQTKRDKRKHQLCEDNNVKLLYYSKLGIKYPYKVYENKEELIKKIYDN